MQVSILQENLAHALGIAGRAVAARSTLPVLGNVLLKAEGGKFTVSASNLEIGIIHTAAAQIKKEGAITMPARKFTDYVNALPPDRVDMDLNAKTQALTLKCANFSARMKGIDASEFPAIPTIEKKDVALIEPDVLRELIARALVSAAQDDSRLVLRSALAEFTRDSLTFSTADGFRLSVACAHLERGLPKPQTALLPTAALQEIARLAGKMEENIAIAFSANRAQALFDLGDTLLVTNLMDGNFPDVTQIIPKAKSLRAVCNTFELQQALKAAMVFARDGANNVRFAFESATDTHDANLTISAASAERGDAVNTLETTMEGEGIEIAFNGKFLQDALAVCNTPQVAFELTASAAPGVLKPVGLDTFTYVLMPMHLTDMQKPI